MMQVGRVRRLEPRREQGLESSHPTLANARACRYRYAGNDQWVLGDAWFSRPTSALTPMETAAA
jgi:hypothetical protein